MRNPPFTARTITGWRLVARRAAESARGFTAHWEPAIAGSALHALTTRIDYLSGFRKQITNPRGQVTTISYQAYGAPSEDMPVRIEAPEGQTTVIVRDAYGKPQNISRNALIAGVSTTVSRAFQYDAQQRLCTRYEPETGVSVFDYDAADNIVWSAHGRALVGDCNNSRNNTLAADRIVRGYDARNRITLVDYPSTTADTDYSYWPDGQIKTASRNNSTWSYSYNSLGALASEALSFQGQTRSYVHGYDSLGNRSSITYPGGELVHFNPDALGQSTQIGTYASAISYHANGSLKQASFGNGLIHNRSLNVRQLPRRLNYTLGTQAQVDLLLGFDANGNVSGIDDLRSGGSDSQSFGYDSLDRLTSASADGMYGNASFQYDAFDNLRRHVLGTRDLSYHYSDNQTGRLNSITRAGAGTFRSFGYDGRGNITNDGATAFTFDLADTVTQVNGPSGVEQYQYDANGHRIQIIAEGQTRYPVYTQDGLLRGEYGTQTQSYYYLGSQLIARSGIAQRIDLIFSSGFEALLGSTAMSAIKSFLDKAAKSVVTTYYLSDHLGSNIATADQSGNISERTSYAPFGETWGETATRGPGYTGHFEDANGLTYMKARYYGGPVGRFMSPDPVGVDPSSGANFNRYWYANNNPHKYVDPDGRAACVIAPPAPVCVAAVAKLAAIIGGATATKVTLGAVAVTGAVVVGAAVYNEKGNEPTGTRTLDELEPIHAPDHPQNDPEIGKLTDRELDDAIRKPSRDDSITVRGNKVLDGNTRINEAKARGWPGDTEVPVVELPELPKNIDDNPLGPYRDIK